MLSIGRFAWTVLEATHLPSFTLLPARHFLQEDQAPQLSAMIAEHASRSEV